MNERQAAVESAGRFDRTLPAWRRIDAIPGGIIPQNAQAVAGARLARAGDGGLSRGICDLLRTQQRRRRSSDSASPGPKKVNTSGRHATHASHGRRRTDRLRSIFAAGLGTDEPAQRGHSEPTRWMRVASIDTSVEHSVGISGAAAFAATAMDQRSARSDRSTCPSSVPR